MASEKVLSELIDPLSGLIGPSLFPRTVRASAGGPVPSDFKDLDSIHNYIKSLELKSPEKLMNEAKRIVDGGVDILESNFVSITENTGITDAIAAKGKDRPRERRPGLDRARKRAQFSLKTSVSQPSVSLKPSLNIDQLADPDDFWDACDRVENAKKEIQKQLGGSMDNLNLYKPSNNARQRRPGILGKSYKYKHRYSSAPSENDDILTPSQETVEQDIPGAVKDDVLEMLTDPDHNPDMDLEEVELAVPTKKTENEFSHILDDLLSMDNEDLDGDRALNLLQERLNIKPLDQENLYIPELDDVGKSRKSSLIIDGVLKSLNRKPSMEHVKVANHNTVSSPTPPRSPFAYLSLLKKKNLQSNPLRDPFTLVNVDFSARRDVSPIHAMDKLHEQVDTSMDLGTSNVLESHLDVDLSANRDASLTHATDELHERVDASKDLQVSSELKSHVEVDITEPTLPKMDAEKVMADADSLPEQFVDENVRKDITEPGISMIDAEDVMGNADNLPEQFVDNNMTTQIANSDSRPSEELDNIETTVNLNENEAMDDPSSRQQTEPEQQPEVHKTKLKRGKRKAGEKRIKKAHSIRKSLADEAVDDPSSRQQIDPEQQPEIQVPQVNLQNGKRGGGENRVRKAHPMRKSLAEAGTSFDNGVRRSKRIKMRPLEFWKGERFLYGRVDDSLKLLGVKYFSPGKGDKNLKVKPYISSDGYKELLEMAARY